MSGLSLVLALWMAAPPADGLSFGVGLAVSQAGPGTPPVAVATDEPPPTEVAHAQPEPEPEPQSQPRAPQPKPRPFAHHSDLDDRIREARRARVMQTAAAAAVMGATAIYGLIRASEAQQEAAAIRNARPRSQHNPFYPR